jgi:hypothetical protein
MKREDIKNGTLVYDRSDKKYGIIEDVGNAVEKGDRGTSSVCPDELSYTIVDILTGKREEGICEHSAMTSDFLIVATKRDVEIYLATLEADALMELAKAKKELAVISDAMNRLSKI